MGCLGAGTLLGSFGFRFAAMYLRLTPPPDVWFGRDVSWSDIGTLYGGIAGLGIYFGIVAAMVSA